MAKILAPSQTQNAPITLRGRFHVNLRRDSKPYFVYSWTNIFKPSGVCSEIGCGITFGLELDTIIDLWSHRSIGLFHVISALPAEDGSSSLPPKKSVTNVSNPEM